MEDLPSFLTEDHDADHRPPRRAPRDSMLLAAELESLEGGKTATVRVRNISATGVMFEADEGFRAAEAVAITLRGIGRVTGRIVWREHDRMGMALDGEIDPLLTRKPVKPAKPPAPPTGGRRSGFRLG